jgi:hypothetical protein
MAEQDVGTDADVFEAGAPEQTAQDDDVQAEQAETTETAAGDPLRDRRGAGPDDPNDPQYKYWQAAYTQSRQQDRQRYGKLESEHQQYAKVLSDFYSSDEYALQVLRHRFPQLAGQLSLDGRPAGPRSETRPGASPTSPVVQMLEQELGSDLAFLAPRLGPVLERAIQHATQAALTPFQQQTQQQQEAARQREEDRLYADMDTKYPGWEARYGQEMQALDAFLMSEDLEHPRFGHKYELFYRFLDKDLARVDATRELTRTARARTTTGRAAPASQPTTDDDIVKAKTNADAFSLAAQAALRSLGQRG